MIPISGLTAISASQQVVFSLLQWGGLGLGGLAMAGWFRSLLDAPQDDSRAAGGPGRTDAERAAHFQDEVARLRLVLRKTAAMTATLNYERVLDMVIDLGTAVLSDPGNGGQRIVGALFLFNEDKLYVAAARGISQADSRVTLPGRSGVLGEALTACEARLCEEPSRDAELQFIAALQPTRQALVIPLGVGLDIYGVLLFAHPKPAFFDRSDRIELMELAAQQAMIALQNARLYHELEQEKERISEIQEEAQKKLARDLHDGPTQSIGAIGMRVNFARRLLERDPKAASDELYKIEELARRTTKEIRQMLFTLRPLVLESEGLIPALHHLADKMMENHGQKVVVEADESAAEDLEVGKQGVVFFIVEEAANNARKHAQADHIWLRLKRDGDMMIVEVADDGRGFDVAAVEADYQKRGSLGMINLRERAELVNGILKIGSIPGRGSTVRVIVPLSVEAAERLHRAGFAA